MLLYVRRVGDEHSTCYTACCYMSSLWMCGGLVMSIAHATICAEGW